MRLLNNKGVRVALAGMAAAAFMATGCTADPGPSTTWVPAGCIAGNQAGGAVNPDILFSGNANVRGNGTLSGNWSNGVFVVSTDGSCSGAKFAAVTVVKAATQLEADNTCATLNAGTGPAASSTGSGYSLPADAWVCSETFYL
ncbi:MAG: hypothetical protein V9F03_09250 [Microthrixaceae bacterium]